MTVPRETGGLSVAVPRETGGQLAGHTPGAGVWRPPHTAQLYEGVTPGVDRSEHAICMRFYWVDSRSGRVSERAPRVCSPGRSGRRAGHRAAQISVHRGGYDNTAALP